MEDRQRAIAVEGREAERLALDTGVAHSPDAIVKAQALFAKIGLGRVVAAA